MSGVTGDRVEIMEVGPREGFQFEKRQLPTDGKAAVIDALARTGVTEIQAVSFVSRRTMPHLADSDRVMELIDPRPGVTYSGLWFSPGSFARAAGSANLTLTGIVTLSASPEFTRANWETDDEGFLDLNRRLLAEYAQRGLPVKLNIAAAFGCNFGGPVALDHVLELVATAHAAAADAGLPIAEIALADTMAWANPQQIRTVCAAVGAAYPDTPIRLHLHDTRGVGIANALAALEAGVRRFDAAIAGLGGCPFAGHTGAAGNIATEDFFYLCESLGVATGLDADALLAASALAESVVGHDGTSRTLRGGFAPLRNRHQP
ncbi:hypothetical protein [Pseudonocardia sp. GCM10023141]|uniref:hypothetical protein n=1 Tax=Pseudonocardia sp. GCM10023141 TaxID=3252653 RepID=UPI00361DFFE0